MHAVEQGVQLLASADHRGAERWLRRARRLAPADPVTALLLASALSRDRPHDALVQLDELLKRHPSYRGAHVSRAAILHRLGHQQTCAAIDSMLRTLAVPSDDAFANLATKIALASNYNGWIGLERCGTLVGNAKNLSVAFDGRRAKKLSGNRLPPNWDLHRSMIVRSSDGPILGGNFEVCSIVAIEGFVEMAADGKIEGWAYAPNDPDARLEVAAYRDGQNLPIARALVSDRIPAIAGSDGLMQAHGFRLLLPLSERGARIDVKIGRHVLYGSPLFSWPLILAERQRRRPKAQLSQASFTGRTGALPSQTTTPSRAPLTVILALSPGQSDFDFGAGGFLEACTPGMRITLLHCAENDEQLQKRAAEAKRRGYDVVLRSCGATRRSANADDESLATALNVALASVSGCDILLLGSDIILSSGALQRLADTAYSAPTIGIVSPLTIDLRKQESVGPAPEKSHALQTAVFQLNEAAQLCPSLPIDITISSITCLFLRQDCIRDVGTFDEHAFAQGPCVDQDFTLRAKDRNWRHVAAGNIVVHAGSSACTPGMLALSARNRKLLKRLHPGYADTANPFHAARLSLAETVWKSKRRHHATILVTHADGGGVERFVRERARVIDLAGGRAIIVRPASGYAVSQYNDLLQPDLTFASVQTLAEFLSDDKASVVEMHHLASHMSGLERLGELLGIPTDIFVHDFAAVCPQVTMCGRTGSYCGEPLLPQECTRCLDNIGSKFAIAGTVDVWRAAQAGYFSKARNVIAPSTDAARRLRRYMPHCVVHVQPPEPEVALTGVSLPIKLRASETLRIATVGALSISKGYNVLLACARDAAQRRLPIHYTVVGHTIGDRDLLDTGYAFVTGRFEEGEAQTLLYEAAPHIGFLPSVWPETWCYALSDLFRANLPVIAFDIGAQSARIKQTGAGKLLPLQTPAPAINDFFLRSGHA